MATLLQRRAVIVSIELAHKILNVDHDTEEVSEIDVRIAKLRKWVSEYPNSAIAWMDLARVFTIKGQGQKAKRAATIALQLAPHDRYIVRCAVRLFLHTGDWIMWNYKKGLRNTALTPGSRQEVNVALISDNVLT
jgi:cytochrome c-type biogenesis protein CcmH/NrfG